MYGLMGEFFTAGRAQGISCTDIAVEASYKLFGLGGLCKIGGASQQEGAVYLGAQTPGTSTVLAYSVSLLRRAMATAFNYEIAGGGEPGPACRIRF